MPNSIPNFKRQTLTRKSVNSSPNKQHKYVSISKERSKSQTKNQQEKVTKLFYKGVITQIKQINRSRKDIQFDSLSPVNKLTLPVIQKKVNRLKLSNIIQKTKNSQESGITDQTYQKQAVSLLYKIPIGPALDNQNHQNCQHNQKIRYSLQKISFLEKMKNTIIQQKFSIKQQLLSKSQNQTQLIINERFKQQPKFEDFNLNMMTNLYKASSFELKRVFSIAIENKSLRQNSSCQTQNLHEKYDDFIKFKQIFNQSFGKLEKIVQQFDNQKRHLIISDQLSVIQLQQKQSELNIHRQRRVVALESEIQQARRATVKALNQLKRQEYIRYESQKNKKQSISSTACSTNFSYNYSFVGDFQSKFNNWRSLIYENKILIYNCVKQLQKIPELLLKIFQKDKNSINLINSRSSSSQQQKVREFLKIKCLKCFETNRNISFLQQKCQKVEPIIKALQNLLNISKKSLFIAQNEQNIKLFQ